MNSTSVQERDPQDREDSDDVSTQIREPSTEPPEQMTSRREARADRRAQRRARMGGSSWMGGVGLIVVGGLFLLQNAGVLTAGQQVWGVLCYLAAAGVAATAVARYRAAGAHLSSADISAAGGALLLAFVATMLTFDLSWSLLWPMLLIIPGAMAVIRSQARAATTVE
jgi:hypothetical protein